MIELYWCSTVSVTEVDFEIVFGSLGIYCLLPSFWKIPSRDLRPLKEPVLPPRSWSCSPAWKCLSLNRIYCPSKDNFRENFIQDKTVAGFHFLRLWAISFHTSKGTKKATIKGPCQHLRKLKLDRYVSIHDGFQRWPVSPRVKVKLRIYLLSPSPYHTNHSEQSGSNKP
jgi:hypothetical protein